MVAALAAHFAVRSLPRELPRLNEIGAMARALRPHIGSGDAVTYLPLYLSRTGDYYGLPFDSRIRPWADLPPERFDRTRVVVAHPAALPTAVPGSAGFRMLAHQIAELDRLLTALAADYGVRYDGREISRRLAEQSVAVGIDRDRIQILTVRKG